MKRIATFFSIIVLLVIGAVAGRLLSQSTDQASVSTGKMPARVATAPQSVPVANNSAGTSSSVSASAIDQATETAYALAAPSVVYVDNMSSGTGSGVIFDVNGDIVTNAHVVDGTTTQRVTLSDGRSFVSRTIGTDSADDLAVIRIQASQLKPARFAAAGSFQVAQTVLAIGSPLGLRESVTSGLISGLGRVEQEPNGAYLPNAIQTSAPINPGNSGGALITLDGRLVGMPTLVQTKAADGTTTQSIGFAVPSSRIVDMANQIIVHGKVLHTGRPYLGVSPTDSASQAQSAFGNGYWQGPGGGSSVTGALVQKTAPDGPAAKAGVQVGDVVTQADSKPVSDAQSLLSILAQKKPGDTIILKINRAGATSKVTVQLSELPA